MLFIIGTAIWLGINVLVRMEEREAAKAWKECEETDWNEYYANL